MKDIDPTPLDAQIKNVIEGAQEFLAEHGSCRVIVGPNSPLALTRVEQVAGFPIHVDQITLVSPGQEDDLVIDGDLVYFQATGDQVSLKDVVRSIDWFGSGDVEFHSADWSSVEKTGMVHLEGRGSDRRVLVDVSFKVVDFQVRLDDGDEWDDDQDDDDD